MTRTKVKIPTTAESVLREVMGALKELMHPSGPRLTVEQAQQITAWAKDYGDALNQMTAVTKNGVNQATYSYDPLGRRVEKAAGATTIGWTYDTEDILRQRSTSSGV